MVLLLIFFVILNFLIGYWNCYVIGKSWFLVVNEGNWWQKALLYAGTIQSALGFTWCYSIVLSGLLLGYSALAPGKLSPETAQSIFQLFNSLVYIAIIPGIVLSGLVLMLHSWVAAYHQRTLSSGAVAAWNTIAQVSNTISMFRHIGPMFESVRKAALDQGKKNVLVAVVCLTVLAMLGGIYTAYVLISKYAKKTAPTTSQVTV